MNESLQPNIWMTRLIKGLIDGWMDGWKDGWID